MRHWSYAKGHGTENDFVLLLDREGMLEIGETEVRFLCDRHAGIGADGLLRAVLAKQVPDWGGDGDVWFMDYRNADGSIAETCGNGLRVFVRYLLQQDLAVGPTVPVATRAGLREATVLPDGRIRVDMGPVSVADRHVCVQTPDGKQYGALTADVGNPHAVTFTDDLDLLQLHAAPSWTPLDAYPAGANVEFVKIIGPRHIAMRVFERGVGETRSCGTGTVAAAAAARLHTGDESSLPVSYQVDVPGGSVEVELTDSQAFLTGPAVLVAFGEVAIPEEG
jgi:diaminopimelate epimerase